MTTSGRSNLILAVDTAGEHGSIALARDGELIEHVELEAPAGFSGILYGELGGLLGRHSVACRDIACFAAASGPGSFTGVRVGLACVKGLAQAVGRPAVAVSNLQALARCGTGELRAPVIDARRGEIYGAVYDSKGALVSDEVVAPMEAWLQTIPKGAGLISRDRIALAPAVAAIAYERLLRGEALDPAALDANYVRRPDVRG